MNEVNRIHKLPADVIDRIAAGEVILRPENALKELIENSLDASSKKISVTVNEGGLSLLQVKDDGAGIHVEDLNILCERFTTSKLSQHSDLYHLHTYGFRGEALASIARVSILTIITSTKTDNSGYTCKYVRGRPVSPPTPCSCSMGTTLIIEDLFYSIPERRKSFHPNEEYCRILQVLQKYSIHYGHVSFSCKKFGTQIYDLQTPGNTESSLSSTRSTIELVYGKIVSSELRELTVRNLASPVFKANALIRLIGDDMKHQTFLLFINGRLVENTPIRRRMETVVSCVLQKKTTKFWGYFSLEVPPESIDVNVHPTKKEVIVLDLELILNLIETEFISKLKNLESSKKLHRFSSSGISRKLPHESLASPPKKSTETTNSILREKQSKAEPPQLRCRTDYRQPTLKHFASREEPFVGETSDNVNEKNFEDFSKKQSQQIDTRNATSKNNVAESSMKEQNIDNNTPSYVKQDSPIESAFIENIDEVLENLDNQKEDDVNEKNATTLCSEKRVMSRHVIAKDLDKFFIGVESGFQSIRIDLNTHPLETKSSKGCPLLLELDIVQKVYNDLIKGSDESVTRSITESTYVGQVNENCAILQMSTSLVMIEIRSLFKEAVVQSIVRRLGVLNSVSLDPAVSLNDLISFSIQNGLLDNEL